MRGGFFSRNNVNEEVIHIGLGEGCSDIGPLKCTALVILGVDPRSHGQLGDEDIAALGKQDRSFG